MEDRKHIINLSSEESNKLYLIASEGTCAARTVKRALILLKLSVGSADKNKTDEVSHLLGISRVSINRILHDYKIRGIDCIYRKKRKTHPVKSKITGEVKAHLIAMACHNPLKGYCK